MCLANTYKSGPNDGSDDIAWWASLAPYVSGLQSEYWEESANAVTPFDTNPCCWTGHWLSWLGLADAAQQNGADFFTVDKGTASNKQLMTYLRGSYLLVWNGRGGGFSYAHEPDDGVDSWDPAWATSISARRRLRAIRPGLPGGVITPAARSSSILILARRRRSVSAAATRRLPARRSARSRVQPQSAAILTSVGAASPPPPPATAGTRRRLRACEYRFADDHGHGAAGPEHLHRQRFLVGQPDLYKYQWLRCDSAGNSCAAIGGETFSGITLSAADVNHTLRATVTAANGNGSTSVNTAPTATVSSSTRPAPAAAARPHRPPPPAAPANTALPTISGTAQQGQNIYTSNGSWSGSPTGYSYQWLRCDSAGTAAPRSAVRRSRGSPSRPPTSTTPCARPSPRPTATARPRSTPPLPPSSAPRRRLSPAPPAAPANTGLPTITGTAQQGQNIYTTTGSWSGSPTCTATSGCAATAPATAALRSAARSSPGSRVSAADVGNTIRVTVTATNASGSTSATSAQTAVVGSGSSSAVPANTGLPTITGTAQNGLNLYTTTGSWSGSPTSYKYQWLRCDSAGANCVPIWGEIFFGVTLFGHRGEPHRPCDGDREQRERHRSGHLQSDCGREVGRLSAIRGGVQRFRIARCKIGTRSPPASGPASLNAVRKPRFTARGLRAIETAYQMSASSRAPSRVGRRSAASPGRGSQADAGSRAESLHGSLPARVSPTSRRVPVAVRNSGRSARQPRRAGS